MKCKFCNEELQEGYKFCTNCGMPIAEEKSEEVAEYFEVVENKKEKSKYDFSEFLGDYKREEERQKEESESKRPVFEKDFTDSIKRDDLNTFVEDNLEDTKKRKLFERTNYNLFEEMNKNKSKNFYEDRDSSSFKSKEKKEKPRREKRVREEREKDYEVRQDFSNDEYVPEGFVSKEELKEIRKMDRRRTVFHYVFNILIVVIAGAFSYFAGETIQNFLGQRFGIFNAIPLLLFYVMLFLALLFLLVPFFKCKGKAKFLLLILSILISWTLIGWIILMIVASLSNRKWKKKINEMPL